MEKVQIQTGTFQIKKFMLKVLLVLGLSFAVSLVCENIAFADISLYVGYPGGPYYKKATFTDEEIEALSDGILYEYSTFDALPALRKGYGRGVELKTLFLLAGIDADQLWRFYFSTEDKYRTDDGGYGYGAWYYDPLVNTTRYYFPDLPECFDWEDDPDNEGILIKDSLDEESVWASAVQVPTILAIESSFERVYNQKDVESVWDDSTRVSEDKKYRLMFGQVNPTDSGASDSAYSVRSITCIFYGYPSINFELPGSGYEVGDSFTFTPTVTAYDPLIEEEAIYDINWASSDPDVAVVTKNEDGSVTVEIVGEGEFTVTASYGNSDWKEFVSTSSQSAGASGGAGGGKTEETGKEDAGGQSETEQKQSEESQGGTQEKSEESQGDNKTIEEITDPVVEDDPSESTKKEESENTSSESKTTSLYKLNKEIKSGGGASGEGEGKSTSIPFSTLGYGAGFLSLLLIGIVINALVYARARDRNDANTSLKKVLFMRTPKVRK